MISSSFIIISRAGVGASPSLAFTIAAGAVASSNAFFVPSSIAPSKASALSRHLATMADDIPNEMKHLVVKSPGTTIADLDIGVETSPTPKPGPDEVLVKVAAAPINPSDYLTWSRKPSYPAPIGYEGCGTVVSQGGGISTLPLKPGTKVGFIGDEMSTDQGSYSEYVTVNAETNVFPMPDDVPIEDCASFYVNPYTAVGILDTAQRAGSTKAIVHTAAASQLGQMIVKLAPSKGMEVIGVVRRPEQKELLENLGAKHVIVTASKNPEEWKAEIKAKVQELGATSAFDAIAGDMPGHLLECLPPGGTVHLYGALAGNVSNVAPLDLIYMRKRLDSFLLNAWVREGGMEKTLPRLYYAGRTVSAGLKYPDGWCCTKFQDTTLENAHKDLIEQTRAKTTETKLRIRFD